MMDIWKHGTYVDTWSVAHFLSGMALACLSYIAGLHIIEATLFSGSLLLLWELFEWIIKIIEPSWNVAIDMVVGIAGFSLSAFLVFGAYVPAVEMLFPVLSVLLLLSMWGFVDFYFRGYR